MISQGNWREREREVERAKCNTYRESGRERARERERFRRQCCERTAFTFSLKTLPL